MEFDEFTQKPKEAHVKTYEKITFFKGKHIQLETQ